RPTSRSSSGPAIPSRSSSAVTARIRWPRCRLHWVPASRLTELMGRRDYEMEAAVQSVGGHVPEPIVRALIVGSSGSNDGTLGGVFKQFFNRSRRKTGLRSKIVLVLTKDSVRVFTCKGGNDYPPRVDGELGAWPVGNVKVAAEAAEKWSAFSATHS